MSINKFNSEGYYDPTTYEALTNIEKENAPSVLSAPSSTSAHPMPET